MKLKKIFYLPILTVIVISCGSDNEPVQPTTFYKKENVSPNTVKCEECEKEHLPTVALRMCLTCGHVGCCDSSIGKHATKHFKDTGHPVMKAIPEDIWKWCYIHEEYF